MSRTYKRVGGRFALPGPRFLFLERRSNGKAKGGEGQKENKTDGKQRRENDVILDDTDTSNGEELHGETFNLVS